MAANEENLVLYPKPKLDTYNVENNILTISTSGFYINTYNLILNGEFTILYGSEYSEAYLQLFHSFIRHIEIINKEDDIKYPLHKKPICYEERYTSIVENNAITVNIPLKQYYYIPKFDVEKKYTIKITFETDYSKIFYGYGIIIDYMFNNANIEMESNSLVKQNNYEYDYSYEDVNPVLIQMSGIKNSDKYARIIINGREIIYLYKISKDNLPMGQNIPYENPYDTIEDLSDNQQFNEVDKGMIEQYIISNISENIMYEIFGLLF